MKNIIKTIAFCALLVLLGSCSDITDPSTDANELPSMEPQGTTEPIVSLSPETWQFNSMEELAKYQNENKVLSDLVAIPSHMLSDMSLNNIIVADGHIALYYTITNDFSEKLYKSSGVENARTAAYGMYYYDDPEMALSYGFIKNGYKPVDDHPSIYCYPVMSQTTGEVVYYSFAYTDKDHLFIVNIPAIAELQKLLPYIETDVVDCFDKDVIAKIDSAISEKRDVLDPWQQEEDVEDPADSKTDVSSESLEPGFTETETTEPESTEPE